ncbi:PREDICTED: uncharacterized protein LOC108373834 isoform X1 [Rhagoletis zephyria]|uniref:uncharacterized protein LOC108373834 isoform X1 n=2 Tax=Rhagoletis zephyria TaxID=28612 RepID=UPI000811670C|nr:PREDICTED: uncharacterized protein LOC108373834 isoform X1 [Rhagoletis zephyria]
MEDNLQFFQAVMESDYSDLYIDAVDEITVVNLEGALEKMIDSSIQNTENYILALRLLNHTSGEMRNKSYPWTALLLRVYVSCNEIRRAQQIVLTLGELAIMCNTREESRKWFGSNYVENIFNTITKEYCVQIDNLIVLRCIVTLLELYPDYSADVNGSVKHFVSKFIDSLNSNTVEYSAKCCHLLLTVSKPQPNTEKKKELWRIYQYKLVDNIQFLLNIFFGQVSLSVVDAVNCGPLHIPILLLSDDPVEKYPQIFIRFKNLVAHLVVTLREPFHTEKLINAKKILNLIKSALDLSHLTARQNETINRTMLALLLPQFYFIMLQMVETLILTLGKNLRRSYKQIWTILGEITKYCTFKALSEGKKSYQRLLVKVWNTTCTWCNILNQGCRSDLLSNCMMKNLLDISLIRIIPAKVSL